MNDSTSMTMPVAPLYGGGNGGFGGAWGSDIWLILIILFACGGWGNGFGGGFGGGYGNMMLGYDFPWLLNGQSQINSNTNNGFRDQMINSGINGLQNSITSGFGDVQTALCNGFAGINATVNGAQSAIAQQLYSNQIADMQTAFAGQTAMNQGFNSLGMNLQQCLKKIFNKAKRFLDFTNYEAVGTLVA